MTPIIEAATAFEIKEAAALCNQYKENKEIKAHPSKYRKAKKSMPENLT